MNRNTRSVYCFISDENNKYYQAEQQPDGSYSISSSAKQLPIDFNPANINNSPAEFATNKDYFSLVRSMTNPLEFIKDGGAIMRHLYFLRKGTQEVTYVTFIQWNGVRNIYELAYRGKVDFAAKIEDPKSGKFTVPVVDDTAWGVLSINDDKQMEIDCSASNPKAVPVLFDGVTLVNKYNYQTVQSSYGTGSDSILAGLIPSVLVNEDGDSYGIVASSGSFTNLPVDNFFNIIPEDHIFESTDPITIRIKGSVHFKAYQTLNGTDLRVYIQTKLNQQFYIFSASSDPLPPTELFYNGMEVIREFDFTINLVAGEWIRPVFIINSYNDPNHVSIEWIQTNFYISTNTKTPSTVHYGLRPLDLAQQIVEKATDGRFTIQSDFFTQNNTDICLSGDSIRQVPDAKLYSSFKEWWQTFNSIYFLALKNVKGNLFIEKAIEVYKAGDNIIDLGDIIDLTLEPAKEYYANRILVGSPKQDLRHPSGRLEFNSENEYGLSLNTIKQEKSLVTSYHLGCMEIEFLRKDYLNQSTVDNTGDKQVYVAQIKNKKGYALTEVETFENITFDDQMLEPIIKSPLPNDIITNEKPTIKGVAQPGSVIYIYIDGTLNGSVIASASGLWRFNTSALSVYVLGVSTGIHTAEATFSDLSAPFASVTFTLNTNTTTTTIITYPTQLQNLYNNKPLIKGVAQAGTLVRIRLDGVTIGSVVADGSGKWELKSNVIPNGSHTLTANGGIVTNIIVNTNVAFPLITYVGSELDGFTVINTLPLIEGVAAPGTVVQIWLSYIQYAVLGTTTADIFGNWSFQVVPVTYLDPVSGFPVTLAPIRNGLNVISTLLENQSVGVGVYGYVLNRPNYSLITGVVDNTVFNTMLSPDHMMEAHYPLFSAMLRQQPYEKAYFQKAGQNGQLVTQLPGGKVYVERDDIPYSEMGQPIALLEWVNITTKAVWSFAKTLYNFANGGTIKANYRGTDLYMLAIGGMKVNTLLGDVQQWKLLMSPLTTYTSLLNLYRNGLTINLMAYSLYHSDYNSLHMVTYDFQQPAEYNFKELYDDWFQYRNDAWLRGSEIKYIQKFQRTETLIDQIITNNLQNVRLLVYRCSDAVLIDTINYLPVIPAPIGLPEIVSEAKIVLANYPEDQYFYVIAAPDYTLPSGTLSVYHSAAYIYNIWSFALHGLAADGDILTTTLVFNNGQSDPLIITTQLSSSQSIDDILNILKTAIEANEFISSVDFNSIDGNEGLTVKSEDGISLEIMIGITGAYSYRNIAISERIETRDKWSNTILIKSSNSLNKTGFFFSTGAKTILRVEGLVKKPQPDLISIVDRAENGNTQLLYSDMSKKRTIRYGTAFGLPDFLSLKMAEAISLDNCNIENVDYVLGADDKIEPSDDVDGHPLFYYDVNMTYKENSRGKSFNSTSPDGIQGVILVVDGEAVGLPIGSLLNIELKNE